MQDMMTDQIDLTDLPEQDEEDTEERMEAAKRLGKFLTEARIARGWNIKQLAYASGVGAAQISYIELGKRGGSFETFVMLAQALKIPAGMFLDVYAGGGNYSDPDAALTLVKYHDLTEEERGPVRTLLDYMYELHHLRLKTVPPVGNKAQAARIFGEKRALLQQEAALKGKLRPRSVVNRTS